LGEANLGIFRRAQLNQILTSRQKNYIKIPDFSKLRPYRRPIFNISVAGLDMADLTHGVLPIFVVFLGNHRPIIVRLTRLNSDVPQKS
jgi:hypothetical protein